MDNTISPFLYLYYGVYMRRIDGSAPTPHIPSSSDTFTQMPAALFSISLLLFLRSLILHFTAFDIANNGNAIGKYWDVITNAETSYIWFGACCVCVCCLRLERKDENET